MDIIIIAMNKILKIKDHLLAIVGGEEVIKIKGAIEKTQTLIVVYKNGKIMI